jgi:hypothetical protein
VSMKPMSDYSFIRGIHLSNMPPIRPQNRPNFGAGPGARRREVIPLDLQLDYCEKLNIQSIMQTLKHALSSTATRYASVGHGE